MKYKLIFHVGQEAGFYSEFNNMVLAILYCRRHCIDFELYSKDSNFGSKNGWTDFFLPFCEETQNPLHHYINKRFDNPKGGKRKVLLDIYRYMQPHVFLTPDLWDEFHYIDKEIAIDEVKEECKSIVEQIYRFNSVTWAEIEQQVNLIPLNGSYVAFHIRGGDKMIEHDILEIDAYIKQAESLSDMREGFVFTDEYDNIELMKNKYPNWTFHTLANETDHGYFHKEFLKLPTIEKRKKLINMFASMELLRNSEYAFCTFSSNVGMFLGMCMGERAIGIDFGDWRIW